MLLQLVSMVERRRSTGRRAGRQLECFWIASCDQSALKRGPPVPPGLGVRVSLFRSRDNEDNDVVQIEDSFGGQPKRNQEVSFVCPSSVTVSGRNKREVK